MFCLGLMRIALSWRVRIRGEGLATKFLQHYTYVAFAMKHMGNRDYSLFDQVDGFFYDVSVIPTGIRSSVSAAWSDSSRCSVVERLEKEWLEPFQSSANSTWFLKNRRWWRRSFTPSSFDGDVPAHHRQPESAQAHAGAHAITPTGVPVALRHPQHVQVP